MVHICAFFLLQLGWKKKEEKNDCKCQSTFATIGERFELSKADKLNLVCQPQSQHGLKKNFPLFIDKFTCALEKHIKMDYPKVSQVRGGKWRYNHVK